MNTTKQKTNWMVDAILWLGFLLAFFMDLTGLEIHQWLGIGLGIMALIHLLLHVKWIKAVAGKLSIKSSIFLLTDILLMTGFALIILTGLLISSWFNLPITNYHQWVNFHIYCSIITLAACVLKLILHWQWISATTRRMFKHSQAVPNRAVTAIAGEQKGSLKRRDFLTLSGLTGITALLAIAHVWPSDETNASGIVNANAASITPTSPAPAATTANITSSGSNQTITSSTSTVSASTSTAMPTIQPTIEVVQQPTAISCVVECDRGCSYPGHCRRYVDNNQNGLCDRGECL